MESYFPPPSEPVLHPPFRWPGGKRQLLPQILEHCPDQFGRYYEPFLGGGALFFSLKPPSAVLADHNPELINFFEVLRDRAPELMTALGGLQTDERTYYSVRRHGPTDPLWRAVRFVYLTTLAFNGIYRVNKRGRFNVPYGRRRYESLRDPTWLQPLSAALASVELRACDFETGVADAAAGDLVYFDPPYTVKHEKNGFVRYNERIYSFDDQTRLSRVARRLSNLGCTVLVSNAHHESIRALYPDFRAEVLKRPSTVAADSRYRTDVREYLFISNANQR